MAESIQRCNWTEYTEDELANTKLFKEYPEGLLYFASVCCALYMLVGIPGNFITIIALARCKKIHNATTAFIMNLACSDMLFCCFNLSMVSVTYWHRSWVFGVTACRLFPVAGYGLVAVSLLSILAITINRYILIAHPELYPKVYTSRYIALMIVGIWIVSFAMLILTWFGKWGRFGMDFAIGSCSILKDCNNGSPKKFLFVGAFLIPCLLILVCYLRIFWIVRKSSKKCTTTVRQRNVRRGQETSNVISVIDTSSYRENLSPEIGMDSMSCPQKDMLELPPLILKFQPIIDQPDEKFPTISNTRWKPNQVGNYISKKIGQSFRALKGTRESKGLQSSSKDRKLLQTIVTIVVCFWVCYLPITFTKLCRELNVSPWLKVLGYLLVYLTTCINPVIYVVMSSDYRQAYKSLFLFGRNQAADLKDFNSQKRSQDQSCQDRKSCMVMVTAV